MAKLIYSIESDLDLTLIEEQWLVLDISQILLANAKFAKATLNNNKTFQKKQHRLQLESRNAPKKTVDICAVIR